MKKGGVSPDDVLARLISDPTSSALDAVSKAGVKFAEVATAGRRPEIARDIKIGYLRAYFIDALMDEATAAFARHGDAINDRSHRVLLM